MKKLLRIALAIVMSLTVVGALASCGKNNGEDAEAAKKAINTVRTLYYDAKKETPVDYEVIGKTKPNNDWVTIEWTVTPAETVTLENFSDYVSVGEINEDNMVLISIKQATVAIDYTLKASVTVGKATESISFERQVPAGADLGDRETVKGKVDFTEEANRTSITSDQQVWEQNGIKVTNDRGSGTAIDTTQKYLNPVRFYKGSIVKIEYPGMKQLIFTSQKNYEGSDDYATRVKTSIESVLSDATITVGEDVTDNKQMVTVVLANPVDVLEFTASAKLHLFAIDITGYKDGATDAEKVAGAKSMLDVAEKTFSSTGTVDLTAAKNGATITWTVKEANEYASIKDGKLSIDKLPESEATVVLVATLKSGSATDTKEFTITVKNIGLTNDGTEAHPYTPSEAIKAGKLLADNVTATTEVYVKGYVIEPGTYSTQYKNFDNMYIADTYEPGKDKTAEDAFYVFRPSPDGTYLTTEGFNKGDLVTFKGKLQNYKPGSGDNIIELTSGTCVAREEVDRTDDEVIDEVKASLTLSKTTFKKVNEEFDLPSTKSGATLTWTVQTTTDYVEIVGNTLKIKSLPTEETTITLSVAISYGDANGTMTVDIKVAPAPSATFEEGTYKLAIQQNGLSTPKKLYFTGEMDATQTFYGGTTEVAAQGADIEVTAVTGGYTFKVVSTGKYIELVVSGNYVNFALVTTASTTIAWEYNPELETFTWTNEKGTYYLGTRSTYTTVSASLISYITGENAANVGVSQFVAQFEKYSTEGMTDEEKVDEAIAGLTLNTYVTKTGEVTLPTVADVEITWESDNTEYVTIVDNAKMNVLKLPETEAVTVKITASVKVGEVTKTTEFNLALAVPVNYGTAEAPLSVTEALAIATTECPADNNVTAEVIYMTGKLTNAPTDKGNYYQALTLADINDATKTIYVYTINLRDDVAAPAQNDVLVISGYMTKYNGGLQFSTKNSRNVYVESNDRGTSTLTLGEHEGATVTGLPESATNGTEVSFTVAATDGKELVAVKVGGKAVDEDAETAGTYKLTVAGNMTVTVETKDAGSQTAASIAALTFSSTDKTSDSKVSSYTSEWEAERNGFTWVINNFNNNNNAATWTFIKTGRKGYACVGMISTKAAVAATVTKVSVTFEGVTADGVNSFKLEVSRNANFTDIVETVNATIAENATVDFKVTTPGSGYYYRIVIDCASGSANGFVVLNKVDLIGFAATTPNEGGNTEEGGTTEEGGETQD